MFSDHWWSHSYYQTTLISNTQVTLLWQRAIGDLGFKRIFCLLHAEKLSYQVCHKAIQSLTELSQGRKQGEQYYLGWYTSFSSTSFPFHSILSILILLYMPHTSLLYILTPSSASFHSPLYLTQPIHYSLSLGDNM